MGRGHRGRRDRPGKGKATPKPALLRERLIRLWASPQGAPKGGRGGEGERERGVGHRQAGRHIPIPGITGAVAKATLNAQNQAQHIEVRDGNVVMEFDYANYDDYNNPLNKIEAFMPGTIVEKRNGVTVARSDDHGDRNRQPLRHRTRTGERQEGVSRNRTSVARYTPRRFPRRGAPVRKLIVLAALSPRAGAVGSLTDATGVLHDVDQALGASSLKSIRYSGTGFAYAFLPESAAGRPVSEVLRQIHALDRFREGRLARGDHADAVREPAERRGGQPLYTDAVGAAVSGENSAWGAGSVVLTPQGFVQRRARRQADAVAGDASAGSR